MTISRVGAGVGARECGDGREALRDEVRFERVDGVATDDVRVKLDHDHVDTGEIGLVEDLDFRALDVDDEHVRPLPDCG